MYAKWPQSVSKSAGAQGKNPGQSLKMAPPPSFWLSSAGSGCGVPCGTSQASSCVSLGPRCHQDRARLSLLPWRGLTGCFWPPLRFLDQERKVPAPRPLSPPQALRSDLSLKQSLSFMSAQETQCSESRSLGPSEGAFFGGFLPSQKLAFDLAPPVPPPSPFTMEIKFS